MDNTGTTDLNDMVRMMTNMNNVNFECLKNGKSNVLFVRNVNDANSVTQFTFDADDNLTEVGIVNLDNTKNEVKEEQTNKTLLTE